MDPRILTFALVGGERSASRSGRFSPGERAPGTHWIGGWVDPRTGLERIKLIINTKPLQRNIAMPGSTLSCSSYNDL
jgi:hypothetical protein